ncbi:MAG TPA: response regulator transcription factor [Candidatus Acidoferrum sp.]|jgi:DNA-binding NarL/FixJ family response regulator|nr:response regulator transcription factor [Candidatus Acidoferrum sp.]
MVRPRILLADDHTLVVEAFKNLLEPHFEVVGTVADGRALLEVAPKLAPDVILVDLAMPSLNGMDAGERLKQSLPNTKLIVLTMTEDASVAAEVMKRWANGFLLKKSAGSELIRAIKEVLKGESYITPKMAKRLLDEFVRDPHPAQPKSLTPRQREVLQLLAEGHTMKEVADVLHVTPRTVAFHKYRIMDEFGLKTNSDLVRFAIKEHVVTAP